MEYKCIKEIWLPEYNEDCSNTEKFNCVPTGSTWERNDDASMIGGEVHLECIEGADNFGWIEITKATLDFHFEQLN